MRTLTQIGRRFLSSPQRKLIRKVRGQRREEAHGPPAARSGIERGDDSEGENGYGQGDDVKDAEAPAEVLRGHGAEKHQGGHEDAATGDSEPDTGLGAAEDLHLQLNGGEHPADQPQELAAAGGDGLPDPDAQRRQRAALEPQGAEHGNQHEQQDERRCPV